MIRNSKLLHRTSVFLTPVLLLLLASCGSYQYSGYSDGIYGESSRPVDRPRTGYERPQNANEQREEKLKEANSYYKNMFAQQADMLENAMQEDVVFTDIDSYSSNSQYSLLHHPLTESSIVKMKKCTMRKEQWPTTVLTHLGDKETQMILQ